MNTPQDKNFSVEIDKSLANDELYNLSINQPSTNQYSIIFNLKTEELKTIAKTIQEIKEM
jgi:hypothetical protein